MRQILIIILFTLFSSNIAISKTKLDNENWEVYFQNDKLIIEYKKQNCIYDDFFNQEYIILQMKNKTDKKLVVSWFLESWYDKKCSNCEQEGEEFRKIITLDCNQTINGKCNLNNNLKIFSNFSDKIEDMPGVNKIVKLTKFELKNILINE